MSITTQDCRDFIVTKVPGEIFPATSWAYDEGSGWDEVYNNRDRDEEVDESDPLIIAEAARYQADKEKAVLAALLQPSNWKRRRKTKGQNGTRWVREFMCDTPDNMFDGQVGYEVLEDQNGRLSLGEYIGD